MISEEKLDFCIKNNYNVLFVGKHGIGKSSIIINAFEKNKLKWKYFSASTMDPWVDFIGVPKEKYDQEKDVYYLDLVLPKDFLNDDIEAIFFDEFNRSHKKVRNAVMELIQFKSINGRKFKNLRFIWAAINPDEIEEGEEEYDVERLDPAQKDRFHIHLYLPYEPDKKYFEKKYGLNGLIAIEWWNEIPNNLKNKLSPRRLDYALEIFDNGGNLKDVIGNLGSGVNISKLKDMLKSGGIENNLNKLYSNRPIEKEVIQKFINNDGNFNGIKNILITNHDYLKFFIQFLHKEKISLLFNNEIKIQDYVLNNLQYFTKDIHELIKYIYENTQNKNLIFKIHEIIKNNPNTKILLNIENNDDKYINVNAKSINPINIFNNNNDIEKYYKNFITFIEENEDGKNKTVLPNRFFEQHKRYLESSIFKKDKFDNYYYLIKYFALLLPRCLKTDLESWNFIESLNYCLKEYYAYNNSFSWDDFDKYYNLNDIKKTLILLKIHHECFIKD